MNRVNRSTRSQRSDRSARASPLLLVCLFVMLPMGALAIETARMRLARLELQNSVDACALGAVQELIDDRRLVDDAAVLPELVQRAAQAAARFGQLNPASGQPVEFLQPVDGRPTGAVLPGVFLAQTRTFEAWDMDAPAGNRSPVNAIRVIGRQDVRRGHGRHSQSAGLMSFDVFNVAAQATAALDHRIVGFRPTGSQRTPLVPVAIPSGRAEGDVFCWQSQIAGHRCESAEYAPLHVGGVDRAAWNASEGRFEYGPDGLPEVLVELDRNAVLLALGATRVEHVVAQVVSGMSRTDFSAQGGELRLGERPLRISAVGELGGAGRDAVAAALEGVRGSGEPRIWPLFTRTGDEHGEVEIVGFVAARVVTVIHGGDESSVSLLLQPCMMCEPTSLIVSGNDSTVTGSTSNPYICKVRLVD